MNEVIYCKIEIHSQGVFMVLVLQGDIHLHVKGPEDVSLLLGTLYWGGG